MIFIYLLFLSFPCWASELQMRTDVAHESEMPVRMQARIGPAEEIVGSTAIVQQQKLFINGVDLNALCHQKAPELRSYADAWKKTAFRGDMQDLQHEYTFLETILRDGVLSPEDQVMYICYRSIIKQIWSLDTVQEIFTIKHGKHADARQSHQSMQNRWRSGYMTDWEWKFIDQMYCERADVKAHAQRIAQSTDMILSTPMSHQAQQRIDNACKTNGVLTPDAQAYVNDVAGARQAVHTYMHEYIGTLIECAAHEKSIEWSDVAHGVKGAIEHCYHVFLVAEGFGDAMVTECAPEIAQGCIQIAEHVIKTTFGTLEYFLGDIHAIDTGRTSMFNWLRSAYGLFKDNPTEAGRIMARGLTTIGYTILSSGNARTQHMITQTKRVIGISNGLAKLSDCTIM